MDGATLPPELKSLNGKSLAKMAKTAYGIDFAEGTPIQTMRQTVAEARARAASAAEPPAQAAPHVTPDPYFHLPPGARPEIAEQVPRSQHPFGTPPPRVASAKAAQPERQFKVTQEPRRDMGMSDPVQNAAVLANDSRRVDIPGYTVPPEFSNTYEMPDFPDEERSALDPVLARMQSSQELPDALKPRDVKNVFRHPPGTKWLYNPTNDRYLRPTEELMRRQDLSAVMTDPPEGAKFLTV